MRRTKVRELMTRDVITLDRGQAMPMAEELLRMLRIRHLPVVDRHRRLVGLVTHRRLLQEHMKMLEQLDDRKESDAEDRIPVSRVMESEVLTVHPDLDAAAALELMLDEEVGSLPVVEDGNIVGIVTSKDFLAFQLQKLRAEERVTDSDDEDDDGPTRQDDPATRRDLLPPPPAPAPASPRLVWLVLLNIALTLALLVAWLARSPTTATPATGPDRVDGGRAGPAVEPPASTAAPAAPQVVPLGAPDRGPGDRTPPVRTGRQAAQDRPWVVGPDSPRPPDARAPAPRSRPRPDRGVRGPQGWIPEKIPHR